MFVSTWTCDPLETSRVVLVRSSGKDCPGAVPSCYPDLACLRGASGSAAMKKPGPAEEIWQLEIDYWRAVMQFDFVRYRGFWHRNSTAWTHLSLSPRRAGDVSGWLTDFQAQGRRLASCRLRLEDLQITGNVAVVHYRVSAVWKNGKGNVRPARYRVSHTWLRVARRWKILGGMSLAEDRLGRAADPAVKSRSRRRPSRRR
jgi:hypothetical protein